jgi:hypothetical protein
MCSTGTNDLLFAIFLHLFEVTICDLKYLPQAHAKKPCPLSEKQGLTNQCTAPPLLLLLLDRNDSIPGITSPRFCQGLQYITAAPGEWMTVRTETCNKMLQLAKEYRLRSV